MLREEKNDLFWGLAGRVNVEDSASVRVKCWMALLGEEGLPDPDPKCPGKRGSSGERVQPSPEGGWPLDLEARGLVFCSLLAHCPGSSRKGIYTPRKMKCAKFHKDASDTEWSQIMKNIARHPAISFHI